MLVLNRKATIDLRMSRRLGPSPSSFVRNLAAGPYSPLERMRLMVSNVPRKAGGRGRCGNYGEPGCWMKEKGAPAGGFVKVGGQPASCTRAVCGRNAGR